MAERLERTFNWARLGGAALIFFLGPSFPNIGPVYLYGLGAFVLAYAAIVYWLLHSERALARFDRLTRAMFVIDIAVVALGMLVFAADPNWTTFVVATLMIIGGGFRFGTAGAFTAAGALALAYVAIAAYRADTYGLVVEPPRLAFHVSVMVLAAYMMSGLLRELEHLRAQREKFVRQAAEAMALRQADRIKSEFLAAMSHDFRSPLTVVRGAVELLLGERPGALTAAQRELAESAERNVRRLEDFTSQLLEIARLEEGQIALEKEEIDSVALVRDVVADHAVLAKEKRQWISLDVDPDPPIVVADRSRMSQALANLIVNAIRYAPQGTPILVAAHRRGDALRIEVRDHGPGIANEDRPRIFEKFFRGKSADGTPGSGLGLAIARSLVTLHGGTLEYEENPGGGAAFVASLPLATS
ncbi:MAG TPA: ATP-binding protein [Candidatus Limnocylindria bacterium]|nr:ATP-binding protein [Candidatus Limnocylindria bacterium]